MPSAFILPDINVLRLISFHCHLIQGDARVLLMGFIGCRHFSVAEIDHLLMECQMVIQDIGNDGGPTSSQNSYYVSSCVLDTITLLGGGGGCWTFQAGQFICLPHVCKILFLLHSASVKILNSLY